ncbi:hypothetical protein RR42_m2052 [Cupriavidus basilensis]|uniref:Uncharacterized protein n=1 Tax=Cupriavidus basilensis TaxID=68895 RepID=A0A0C4YB30_9BURK|nr:hypothetical protein RR42_m2052 [Cupriavidus basilensis]
MEDTNRTSFAFYPPSAKKNRRVPVFIDWIVARLEQRSALH